jgi:GNAT superfamily N-acetyltransferase
MVCVRHLRNRHTVVHARPEIREDAQRAQGRSPAHRRHRWVQVDGNQCSCVLVSRSTTHRGDFSMVLATWWQGDPELHLAPVPDFHAQLADDDAVVVRITHLGITDVGERRRAGHRPYIGSIGDTAVIHGWVATRTAVVSELPLVFPIPAGDCYLWDFVTVPTWQGKGLYQRLLHAIVRLEDADRFWIIHAPENVPSSVGIQTAGFQALGQLAFQPDGSVGLIPIGRHVRAPFGAALLGVPLLDDGLSPCLRCMDQVVCRCQLAAD